MQENEILKLNKEGYQIRYSQKQAFLRYPADWVIRFHNMYLKQYIPNGRILDYGCGSGNNSIFFIDQGYETYGVEVVDSALDLIKANIERNHYNSRLIERFLIIPPDSCVLPFGDGFFDVIVSNQVLYYLASEQHIKKICKEFVRCLCPGGIVLFTMMGPKNYYITNHVRKIHNGNIYEIVIGPPHRLSGIQQFIYVVRDENELNGLFSDFECVSIGYFDQSMFDMKSNFHGIYVGSKG